MFSRLATDIRLDCIERADPLQGFVGERRLRCCIDVVKLPSCVDHPNTIGGLRFVVSVPFASRVVASRQRRSLLAG
jgi:hypothetical protein